ncbi:glycosyltransferase family 4 protein [Vibrio ponticus]|nr:glycosyltransferase family 4 protein [Vibrio ponticus]
MKMCNAFSIYKDTILIGSEGENTECTDILKGKYGVDGTFDIFLFRKEGSLLGVCKYFFNIFKKVINTRSDIIYGRHLIPLFMVSFFRSGIVYEAHALPPNRSRRKLEELLFKRNGFRKLVVISEVLKQDYLELFPQLTSSDILVAHDGADIPHESNGLSIIREKERLSVGYVGHLYKGRGIEVIISLARMQKGCDFYLVGGMPEDIAHWKKETDNDHNIYFVGHLDHADLHDYYTKFDVLIAPYQQGSNQSDGKSDTSRWMSPMKIFEYMSNQKPIICSDLPVLREVLNDENAILVTPDSVEAWSLSLDKLHDLSLRKKIAERAYIDFTENYTWQKRAEYILDKIS